MKIFQVLRRDEVFNKLYINICLRIFSQGSGSGSGLKEGEVARFLLQPAILFYCTNLFQMQP